MKRLLETCRIFLVEESGFYIFEKSMLMNVGVILALLVTSFVLFISSVEYMRMENEFVGNGAEANEALQRFSAN
ncbi:hypothetical protein M3202_21300 [Alkalihalobacillus oceani]|uniref:Uncharacterized protein n=1 Tax=Halalkalibacter oceani TaxID=1653776 RepID=A0A9X2IQ06_9BACI|nr:hypothetical protein [Halalkalibacter oceani]MCM3716584.1 hypothetical protein [Halalkalibacter oceani]